MQRVSIKIQARGGAGPTGVASIPHLPQTDSETIGDNCSHSHLCLGACGEGASGSTTMSV